jgi:predicted KAP-like P-loop ATPase
MSELRVSIDSPTKEFTDHLQIENNNRVLFSGPFGIGKTTFIKKYFDDRSGEYFTIFLRPVNYSVASNEDEVVKS